MSGGWPACSSDVKSRACSPPSPCYCLRRNFATLRRHLTEPTAAAPASPSTEETVSHQLGARGNDRDQHQLPECLRCNFIAHVLSDVHAEHDRQHGSIRIRIRQMRYCGPIDTKRRGLPACSQT